MMRILTVKQPWASLLILGHKPVENRKWGTDYRGDVGIIAGQTIDKGDGAVALFGKYMVGKERATITRDHMLYKIDKLPRGGVIGVVELYGIVTEMDSEWFVGPKGLLMRRPRQTDKLLPMPGNLCMFTATDQDEAIIRRHLV